MKPYLSILISSYKRLEFIRRTLYSIQKNHPKCSYELVICEEISDETPLLLQELEKYLCRWTVVLFDADIYGAKTGAKKYYNDPCVTNNLAFLHSKGDIVGLLGNDIIITPDCFDNLLFQARAIKNEDWIIYTTTYNCPQNILDHIGEYGEHLTEYHIQQCEKNVLQSVSYKTIVTNYLSICPHKTWEKIRGYDNTYFLSIAGQDSDFSRRVFAIPNSVNRVCTNGITLHQQHPSAQFTDKKFWDEGLRRMRLHYDSWDGGYLCKQDWPMKLDGVIDVIKNH